VLIPAGHRSAKSISGQDSDYRSEADMFNHALELTRMAQRVGSLRRSAHHHCASSAHIAKRNRPKLRYSLRLCAPRCGSRIEQRERCMRASTEIAGVIHLHAAAFLVLSALVATSIPST
jgi:hypothetical protein